MAERQTYPNSDGTYGVNPMLDYGQFQKTRREGLRLYRGIASLTVDGVLESIRLLYDTWKENKVEATIVIIGVGATVFGVPLFTFHVIAGAIAPAQISNLAPEAARMGNFAGRLMHYTGDKIIKPVATEMAIDAYSQTNQYGGTVPVSRNSRNSSPSGMNNIPGVVQVSNTSGGTNNSFTANGLTADQEAAIQRAMGN